MGEKGNSSGELHESANTKGDSGLQKKTAAKNAAVSNKNPGVDLLSHTVSRAVPSALKGLTTVFGMGTGGSLSLSRPEKF